MGIALPVRIQSTSLCQVTHESLQSKELIRLAYFMMNTFDIILSFSSKNFIPWRMII